MGVQRRRLAVETGGDEEEQRLRRDLEFEQGTTEPPRFAGSGGEDDVWLTDMAGLSRKQAVELMCWKAQALLRGAISP